MEDWKAHDRIIQERQLICLSCDKYVIENRTCSVCNCSVPFRTSVASVDCPIKKWDKVG